MQLMQLMQLIQCALLTKSPRYKLVRLSKFEYKNYILCLGNWLHVNLYRYGGRSIARDSC